MSLIPSGLKSLTKDLLGITTLQETISGLELHLDQLEEHLYESKEDAWERSKRRWRETAPTTQLTWSKELRGDGFISKVASYNAFGSEKAVLEIGPGYGRLLKAMMSQKTSFNKYVGVDISTRNVKYLKENFSSPKIDFICGDVEKISLNDAFDVVLSSLVFKHLFPSFERTLVNIKSYIKPDGLFFFDLIEGKRKFFENDDVTYIRHYTKSEVLEILDNSSLDILAFDEVQHDREHNRLLVVAKN